MGKALKRVPRTYFRIGSDDQRREAWALARLVGTVAAARSLGCSRETVRRIVAEIEGDEAARAAAVERLGQIHDSLKSRTSSTYARALARLDAMLADPKARLTPGQLLEIVTALAPLSGVAGASNTTGPVVALPAFLLRERREDAPHSTETPP